MGQTNKCSWMFVFQKSFVSSDYGPRKIEDAEYFRLWPSEFYHDLEAIVQYNSKDHWLIFKG